MKLPAFLTAIACVVAAPFTHAGEKSPILSSPMGPYGGPKEEEAAKLQGAATAAKDIKAGVFRILYFGPPWPNGKPLVDDDTGYRTQIVAGCLATGTFCAEVAAYNDAMRERHTKTEKEEPQKKR